MNELPLVLDTGVLASLAAATGSWDVLATFRRPIIVTQSVMRELRDSPPDSPGAGISLAPCMFVWEKEFEIPPWLLGALGEGEASVIALTLRRQWTEVGMDEFVGRSVAKTCRLRLTGSLGLLIRAKRRGYGVVLGDAIDKIRESGIWIAPDIEQAVLKLAKEKPRS